MKLSRQNKIVVGIVALVLALTVGYALFSQSLNIGGTASAKGDFKLIFADASEIDKTPTCVGFSGECTLDGLTSTIDDKKTLKITVNKLNYPGAYVQIPAVIKNEGTVDAKLTGITTPGLSNDDIEVTYTGVVQGDVFTAGSSKDITITVKWKESSESTSSLDFNIVLNYEQATGTSGSEGTGGGSESGDTSWKFKVDDSGTITAYNYNFGTDVQVPEEVNGIPVTTINKNSFLPKGNVELFQDESAGKMYVIIDETGDNYTNVKEKIVTMVTAECGEDSSCIENMKSMLYVCKDKNTCYNVLEEENGTATVTSIPDTVTSGGSLMVDPDPSVGLEVSITEPKANITSLDLSAATNLTTIGDNAFNTVGLTSINFGENSNLQTIGNSAFDNNQLSGELVIPASVTTIGDSAFHNNQINSITIPTGVTTIESYAFYGNQISNLNLNNATSLITIGDAAFGFNQISSLDLSNVTNLTTIGNFAFCFNQISGDLVIPANVITLSGFNNNQISELTIPSSVTTIGESAFLNNQISSLTIPSSVITIENNAFQSNQISNLNLSNATNLTTIGDATFGFNQISGDLVIPLSVTTIGASAFWNSKISKLTIPSNVTSIGASAFDLNNTLKSILIKRTEEDFLANVTTGSDWYDTTLNPTITYEP